MPSFIGRLSFLVVLVLAGCGDDEKNPASDGTDATSGDSSDVPPDTSGEVTPDTATEVEDDTTTDVQEDTQADVTEDTTSDVADTTPDETVADPTVTGITISPDEATLCAGETVVLAVMAAYSDGTSGAITPSWSADPDGVVTIDASTGLVTAEAEGSVTITARYTDPIGDEVHEDAVTLTVEPACIEAIVVSGPTEVFEGATIALTATGTFTDGSDADVTADVTWSSDWPDVATVSNDPAGEVTGLASGAATISATSGDVRGTYLVTVRQAEPRLELTGPDGPLVDGATADVGDQDVGVPFTRAYVIANTGTKALAVTGITMLKAAAPLNCEQTLSLEPADSVAPGDTTTFEISATVLDEGPANCPFVVATDDPDAPSFRVDVAAVGVAPAVKKSAAAICGIASGFGYFTGVLADFTPDGTLVTTNTPMGNCMLTTQVGTIPGGTTVNEGADAATCGSLSCAENNNVCQAFGAAPYAAGASLTVSMTDPLLGGLVTHTFPKAPGTLTRAPVGASVSRSAPLTFTTSGGVAGTLTLVTIQQQNPDGQTTVICEYPADSASITVPTSILGLFHDGAFTLLVDTRVQAFSVNGGYDVVLGAVNSTTPQQSSFSP